MFELRGKSAIVTGGARGIGGGIALALATQGADVAVADILPTDDTVAEIQKLGRKALGLRCDVTDKAEVDDTVKKVLDAFGKVDILVNNVGWDQVKPFVETTPDLWDKLIAINYKGVLTCTRAVIDHMIGRNSGRIINIGSDAGRVGSMGESVYSGCKGAVIAFTKTMARELARNKITVNAVCPGPTRTEGMEETVGKGDWAAKVVAGMESAVPLKRLGEPKDIGAAVAFLASDEAGYITGQTLSVSGGLTMV